MSTAEYGRQFEKIAQDAINRAQRVPCSLSEYIIGLEMIVSEILGEMDAAKESESLSDGGR